MPASVRMSASQPWITSSKVFDRWLTSRIDMPTPGSDTRSRCASSRTSSGSTAGPAEKLKIRVAGGMTNLSALQLDDPQIQHVRVAGFDPVADRRGRLAVEIDSRDGGLGPLEHDVLGLLDVEVRLAQVVEDMRENTWSIAMPHDEHVRRRRSL